MIQVEYYFSLLSPWSYLGHYRFNKIAEKHNIKVIFKPIPMFDLFAETGGLPANKRHITRQAYRIMELKRFRKKLAMPLTLKPAYWPYDANLAHSIIFAMIDNDYNPMNFIQKSFVACWSHEKNMAQEATIIEILEAIELDRTLIAEAKKINIATRHEENFKDAIAANVFGAPSYVWKDEVFWGQDRVEFLDEALSEGREAYNSQI